MENGTDIRSQLARFKAELSKAEEEASLASRRVNYLRQVVDGLNGLLRADAPASAIRLFDTPGIELKADPPIVTVGGDHPVLRGRAAVRAVLEETRRALSIPELVAEIERRGWMPDVERRRDATASSVQRLVQDGEAERVGRGVYRLRLDQLPPPPEEGDG
ncbi:MAG TPA: hypothetical protein VFU30_00690 [Gaiellaceae bacterium]|nr:hypothetical protein [Gaiellaceae bacterium]